jgi:hypothetical protein
MVLERGKNEKAVRNDGFLPLVAGTGISFISFRMGLGEGLYKENRVVSQLFFIP